MGIYYDFLYAYDWFATALPFIIACVFFYVYYSCKYRRLSTRVRTKTMIKSYVTLIYPHLKIYWWVYFKWQSEWRWKHDNCPLNSTIRHHLFSTDLIFFSLVQVDNHFESFGSPSFLFLNCSCCGPWRVW